MRPTDYELEAIRKERRFENLILPKRNIPFTKRTVYDGWQEKVESAITGQQGEARDIFEKQIAEYIGREYAVAMDSPAAALQMALKFAAAELYHSYSGISTPSGMGKGGCLYGKRVFCQDMMRPEMAAAVVCEGGEPVFIDNDGWTWNMDPEVLERAFYIFPDVKIVIVSNTNGVPALLKDIVELCAKNGAILIEDASDALGSYYGNRRVGFVGSLSVTGFREDGVLYGKGGALLFDDYFFKHKTEEWVYQSGDVRSWHRNEDLPYDCGMTDYTAAFLSSQLAHLDEEISRRKTVYDRYASMIDGSALEMQSHGKDGKPNYQRIAIRLDSSAMYYSAELGGDGYVFEDVHGATCPQELCICLQAFGIGTSRVTMPLHRMPFYRNHSFVCAEGEARYNKESYGQISIPADDGEAVYNTSICLPADPDMTEEEQKMVMEIIERCFYMRNPNYKVWTAEEICS
ncbi:MAG: DegT/DnrJ/EryC1/StrS family aminotransferase [Lachnospiraceae bacterium]|nr:DegT/DnrJ/EryC1/StrS family aminotransferase [Lachnospiraceae bacterium]